MSTPSPRFHVAMFPWFAVGHLTPFFHLSTKLAEMGHKITFLLPKKAITLLQPLNTHPHDDLVKFHPLSVPHVDGLPPGTETASDIPISSCSLLVTAMDLTRGQVEAALLASRPDFVLYDFAYWVPEIARPLGIKSILYNVVPSAAMAFIGAPSRNVSKDNPLTEEQLAEPPPGYPSKTVVIHRDEAKSFMFITMPFGDGITFYDRMITATIESDAIAMRTCKELDGSICDYVGSQFNKPVFYTGPALPEPSTDTKLEARWADWLNRFDRGSVVFCAFGSQCILEKDQFQELLLGFEITNLPFLVSLKPPTGASTVEEAFPDGFEERTEGRGVVHGGWIQQTWILNHPSVGCFVTHCGFGSIWESLVCDSQLVLAPQYQDHFLSARLLGGELKVGLEVERDHNNNGWYSKESLSKAIKSLMMNSDQDSSSDHQLGVTLRKNHARLKEKLTSPNFMSGYIDGFVRNLEDLRSASYA